MPLADRDLPSMRPIDPELRGMAEAIMAPLVTPLGAGEQMLLRHRIIDALIEVRLRATQHACEKAAEYYKATWR
jgi:hypothetical protein